MRYATCKTWADFFEEEEGIKVNAETIRSRLRNAEIIGMSARDKVGKVLNYAYFSEIDVRQACADILIKTLQANENGFIEIKGVLYAPVNIWAKHFRAKDEGITVTDLTITTRLKEANIIGMTARSAMGRIFENAYFSEGDIRKACQNELKPCPQADEQGFFTVESVAYGSARAWSDKFQKEGFDISEGFILKELKRAGKKGIRGKDQNGRIRGNSYFNQKDVKESCKLKFMGYPHANEEGSFMLKGVTYGSTKYWANYFTEREGVEMTFSFLYKAFKRWGKTGIAGIAATGRLYKNAYFSEADARDVIVDIEPMPTLDQKGFLIKGKKMVFATVHKWSQYLQEEKGISIREEALLKKLNERGKKAVMGRTSKGKTKEKAFYAKDDVMEVLLDQMQAELRVAQEEKEETAKNLRKIKEEVLKPQSKPKPKPGPKPKPEKKKPVTLLIKVKSDKNGFFEKSGQRYAACPAWAKDLTARGISISYATLNKFLDQKGKEGVDGYDKSGHFRRATFYSENDVIEALGDRYQIFPEANENGFFVHRGEKYGTRYAWSQQLPISTSAVNSNLKKAGKQGMTAKDCHGVLRRNAYYSESDVRAACATLLAKRNSKRS